MNPLAHKDDRVRLLNSALLFGLVHVGFFSATTLRPPCACCSASRCAARSWQWSPPCGVTYAKVAACVERRHERGSC